MNIADIKKALGKDFLNRDKSSAVHARSTGRLGWEKTVGSGRGLSSFATAFSSEEEALKAAYRNACDMIAVMNIPGKVRIHVNPKAGSCTDSKNVWVSTSHFDDASISVDRKMDIFTGLAVHEGCHLLYTDFSVEPAKGGRDMKVVHDLHNVIEDERIEHILGEDTPGLSNFIREVKYYFFNKYAKEHKKELDSLPRPARILNAVLQLVRYPNVILDDDALLEEFGELLIKVRACFDPWPKNTAEALTVAERIYDIIVDEIRNDNEDGEEGEDNEEGEEGDGGKGQEENGASSGKSDSGKSKKGKGSEGKGESKGSESKESEEEGSDSKKSESGKPEKGDSAKGGNSEKDSNDGASDAEQEEDSDEDNPKTGKAGNGDDEEEEEEEGKEGRESREGKKAKAKPSLTREQAEKILGELSDMIEEMGKTPSGRDENEASAYVKGNPLIEDLCTGELVRGTTGKSYIKAIKDSAIGDDEKANYEKSLSRVRKYIPSVRRILEANGTQYQFSLRGMRSGRLDAGKLAEAMQGSQTVYTQRGEVKSDRIAVCLLVDQSGSMYNACCRAEDGSTLSRIDVARDTAVLLDEALSKLPNVDLFVFGHAADELERGATEIYTYRDRQTKGRRTLGACVDKWNNADGYAILETARLVRKQTQEKCLFFMISDGQPAAYVYDRINGVYHTREAVKEISRQGFIPVQIAIDSSLDPSTMFKHYVKFTDLKNLAPELGKMVKKAVLENSKRQASIA